MAKLISRVNAERVADAQDAAQRVRDYTAEALELLEEAVKVADEEVPVSVRQCFRAPLDEARDTLRKVEGTLAETTSDPEHTPEWWLAQIKADKRGKGKL